MKELKNQKAVDSFLKQNARGQVWFRNSSKYAREFRSSVTGETMSVGALKFFDSDKAFEMLEKMMLTDDQLLVKKAELRRTLNETKQKLIDKLEADDFSREFEGDDLSELASKAEVLSNRLKKTEELVNQ